MKYSNTHAAVDVAFVAWSFGHLGLKIPHAYGVVAGGRQEGPSRQHTCLIVLQPRIHLAHRTVVNIFRSQVELARQGH